MYLPREISDPVAGVRIAFDETASGDERLVWEERRPANRDPLPAHYHPTADERFAVLEGHLVVQIGGVEAVVDAADEIVVPAETPHRSYTEEQRALQAGSSPARAVARVPHVLERRSRAVRGRVGASAARRLRRR